tara:strand:- start:336 stop:1334 length:999 start_codon:yes stop_codon:yes gene_type:complete
MKQISIIILFLIAIISNALAENQEKFLEWKKTFKVKALNEGISESTFSNVMKNAKFLPKVIKYDRYQPEFYEDTITYVSKRTSDKKVKNGIKLYETNQKIINKIDKKFSVEKELLLALMGIETNFGTYVGKMDIVSSLATLSFDKRRSAFFTNELLTVLKLVDEGIIDYKILYGSWAGAFGNFQFMPSTIQRYAIDHDSNELIELKTIEDSFASAANYLNKIGWKKNQPCFYKINLKKSIPKKYLNSSARKIKNKKKVSFFEKYITNYEDLNIKENVSAAIITPDKDIVSNPDIHNPAYIVFDNYELILKWNRSLRFAIATCTLKNKFSNVL